MGKPAGLSFLTIGLRAATDVSISSQSERSPSLHSTLKKKTEEEKGEGRTEIRRSSLPGEEQIVG